MKKCSGTTNIFCFSSETFSVLLPEKFWMYLWKNVSCSHHFQDFFRVLNQVNCMLVIFARFCCFMLALEKFMVTPLFNFLVVNSLFLCVIIKTILSVLFWTRFFRSQQERGREAFIWATGVGPVLLLGGNKSGALYPIWQNIICTYLWNLLHSSFQLCFS